MRRFARLLTALLAFALISVPAMAFSESGTHAWSKDAMTLRDGPGTAYTVTGQIGGDLAIKVLRCQRTWCLVDGDTGRGWTSKQLVSFGKGPAGPVGVMPDYPPRGTVCFYTGTNYSGAEYCFTSGHVSQDLKLAGLDNAFASVRLSNVPVAACRDRFFQSYCERIVTSQPVLDEYLVHNLTAFRVY